MQQPIKASWPQQCRVQPVWPIGGCEHNHACTFLPPQKPSQHSEHTLRWQLWLLALLAPMMVCSSLSTGLKVQCL